MSKALKFKHESGKCPALLLTTDFWYFTIQKIIYLEVKMLKSHCKILMLQSFVDI